MIKTKIVSSLEKAFLEDSLDKFERLTDITALKGERVSCQLLHTYETSEGDIPQTSQMFVYLEGSLAKYATVRNVENVTVIRAVNPGMTDDNYLRTTPGLYPDVLTPVRYPGEDYVGRVAVRNDLTSALWIEVELPDCDSVVGDGTVTLRIKDADNAETVSVDTLNIKVINASLPEQTLYYTDWFHCDCLAQYYNLPVWSERHWEIIENYARMAHRNGVNLLLTPVFTPALDTAIGGERLTNQLVGVTKCGEEYSFDFTLLDRWVDMCDRIGIKFFEIAHFFTQWGAGHAPKVMATVDGEYKRIFGWDTDAFGDEYRVFLRAFVTAFLEHMKARGDDKRCFFHISDEPTNQHLENYKKARATVSDLLEGYTIMDAASRYSFYESGLVNPAIPANNHMKDFLDNKVPGLWTYYCCMQCVGVSNRLISMPGWRNRSLGMQLYKYDIKGFLHWGYNFYNNRHSGNAVNPYLNQCGDDWVPAGDMFSVYPESDGTPLESSRAVVFYEALQDLRAMQLCEQYYSHEEIVAEIERVHGGELVFERCAYSSREMLEIRGAVNAMIAKAVECK